MAETVPRHAMTGAGRSTHWNSNPRVKLVSPGVGLVAFLATESMHYLLVPDIGRHWERLLAEGVSAVVVTLLTARLMHAANERREAALLRMQVISEMNHHIRNALAAVSLSTDSIQNQQCIRVISESVDHIEWALRKILLRRRPLPEKRAGPVAVFPISKHVNCRRPGAYK